ncbi:hypothetical protein [Dysgonomonas macrotermitis]|uniref:Uncharacterized protein n=1 Tax=Dysgonomonas macrotermitis TaxID=1346286 RepID=A0A1M5F8M6_9BACT|nr:hypothetical protein [Dysgonomonas macrotermitis]SHF87421.1 hypothetical protein SAMN05444362_11177 [Dysgonomonas macrotermitis]
MSKLNYKVLYHFENEKVAIVEIKRNGLINADKAQEYLWLFYDKPNDMLSKLEFVSMDSNDSGESRKFENATIEFNLQSATFKEKGKVLKLDVINADKSLSTALKEAIGDYLLLQSFRSERY